LFDASVAAADDAESFAFVVSSAFGGQTSTAASNRLVLRMVVFGRVVTNSTPLCVRVTVANVPM